jgi:hypothetical protein
MAALSLVNRQRLARAKLLVHDAGGGDWGTHSISVALDGYCNDVMLRALAVVPEITHEKTPHGSRDLQQLHRATTGLQPRTSDLLTRLQMIEWMRLQFASLGDPDSRHWSRFASLAIKDFHVDVGSLLDVVAPVVIRSTCLRMPKGYPPGWAYLVGKKCLQELPQNVRDLLVALDGAWAHHVREIRNLVTHGDHLRIVFHGAPVGTFFQVYDDEHAPQLLDPKLLDPLATNVVNFSLYSAFVLGELLVFFEDLGSVLAVNDGRNPSNLTPAIWGGDFSVFVNALDALLAITY